MEFIKNDATLQNPLTRNREFLKGVKEVLRLVIFDKNV
jgi:hypothetical protein